MDDNKSSKDGAIVSKESENRKPGKPKGLPKSGGRTKGTVNKRTEVFAEAIEQIGFGLPERIKNLYESTNDEYIKLALINLVVKYVHPVPKPREVDTDEVDVSSPEEFTPAKILQITNEKE